MVITAIKDRISVIYPIIQGLLIITLAAALLGLAVQYIYFPKGGFADIYRYNGEFKYLINDELSGNEHLPTEFTGLAPSTSVVLTTNAIILPGESLLIKNSFAPMKLYINDVLHYETGKFASFLNDPPTMVTIVDIPITKAEVTRLRFEYTSPTQRTSLKLPELMIGEETALLTYLIHKEGIFFILGIFYLASGVFIAAGFFILINKGKLFFWLGAFAVSAGIWILAECDLTLFVVPYPSLLYVLTYGGLFAIAIPFLKFGIIVLRRENTMPLRIMLHINYLALLTAFLLQLSGLVDFSRSLYFFHFFIPLAFLIFAACVTWEYVHYRQSGIRPFFIAVWLFALFAVIEVINFWFNLQFSFTYFFQIGLFIFMLTLIFIGGQNIRDSIKSATEKNRLAYEVEVMQLQLEHQQDQYKLLTSQIQRVREARHDLRHHMNLLNSYINENKITELCDYVQQYSKSLKLDKELLICNNYAVNSIINYYVMLAEKQSINFEYELAIDEIKGISDIDLCIIYSNCLENAIAGAFTAPLGSRVINIRTKEFGKQLCISIDNSFDGIVLKAGENFVSRKNTTLRNGSGISSVQAVVRRYHGKIKVDYDSSNFYLSILLPMEG